MTEALQTSVDKAMAALSAISDPVERFNASRNIRDVIDGGSRALKEIQAKIAQELKVGRSWREVGELMGGISGQRAEQISRGV